MTVAKLIKIDAMLPVMQEIMNNGQAVRLTVTGMSMFPFLRENIDSVELVKTSFDQLKVRQIVLIKRTDGAYVLHRVSKITADRFYMIGDAQMLPEGPLTPEQLIGAVDAVWRRNKRIPCGNPFLRLTVWCWMGLLRHRGRFLRIYEMLSKKN